MYLSTCSQTLLYNWTLTLTQFPQSVDIARDMYDAKERHPHRHMQGHTRMHAHTQTSLVTLSTATGTWQNKFSQRVRVGLQTICGEEFRAFKSSMKCCSVFKSSPQSKLCVLILIQCPFHTCVTAVACKRPRPFCQKCRWQVTPKHAKVGVGWLCCCAGIVWEPIRKRAHTQLIREHSATVVSAHWAIVDWYWPKV